jgi:hypothetical protein
MTKGRVKMALPLIFISPFLSAHFRWLPVEADFAKQRNSYKKE